MPPRALPTLRRTRDLFRDAVRTGRILTHEVTVRATPLTPTEAIGTPKRPDFPIVAGRERVIEASFLNAKGHAFTDSPSELTASLADIVDLPLHSSQERAIFVASLNAVLAHLGRAKGTVHCKDDDPELCGAEIARSLRANHGHCRVGLVGMNPAIAEHLVDAFGADRVHIADLCATHIGVERFGVPIWDGRTCVEQIVAASDVLLVTGTTLVNDTFDIIWDAIQATGKVGIVFGVTAAGVCALTGIPRLCPCGRSAEC